MRSLGWSLAEARIERIDDEVTALIEFNRQRAKTWSERYREIALLLPRLSAEAAARRAEGARAGAAARHGMPVTNIGATHGKSRAFDEVAELTGIKRETARKLVRVFEAIDCGELGPGVAASRGAGEPPARGTPDILRRDRTAQPVAARVIETRGDDIRRSERKAFAMGADQSLRSIICLILAPALCMSVAGCRSSPAVDSETAPIQQ